MDVVVQLIVGLWSVSQGRPNTTGLLGEGITNNFIVSVWSPESEKDKGAVWCVTGAKRRPSKTNTCLGKMTRGRLNCWTRSVSMKFSSAPESTKMCTGGEWSAQCSLPFSWRRPTGIETEGERPPSTPWSASGATPFGRAGQNAGRCPPPSQYRQRPWWSRRCFSAGLSPDRPSCIGSSTGTGGREASPSCLQVAPPEGAGESRGDCRLSCRGDGLEGAPLTLCSLPASLPKPIVQLSGQPNQLLWWNGFVPCG